MRTTRRTVAVVGAMVAVGATTLMGIAAGTASAQAPGRCLENVNVRAEPSIESRIVAVCEAGTAVQTDEIRNGFVQLTDQGGWAAAEYVEVDGRPAGAPGSAPRTGGDPSAPGAGEDGAGEDATGDDTAGEDATGDDTAGEDAASGADPTEGADATGGEDGADGAGGGDEDAEQDAAGGAEPAGALGGLF